MRTSFNTNGTGLGLSGHKPVVGESIAVLPFGRPVLGGHSLADVDEDGGDAVLFEETLGSETITPDEAAARSEELEILSRLCEQTGLKLDAALEGDIPEDMQTQLLRAGIRLELLQP